MAAVRAVFGEQVTLSGCWFHYAQAVMKRLKKLGLTDAYRSDEDTQVVYRSLLSLPLLPAADINPAFRDVTALVTDDSAWKAQLVPLCRYVERQWLHKSTMVRRGYQYVTTRHAQTTRSRAFTLLYGDVSRLLIRTCSCSWVTFSA